MCFFLSFLCRCLLPFTRQWYRHTETNFKSTDLVLGLMLQTGNSTLLSEIASVVSPHCHGNQNLCPWLNQRTLWKMEIFFSLAVSLTMFSPKKYFCISILFLQCLSVNIFSWLKVRDNPHLFFSSCSCRSKWKWWVKRWYCVMTWCDASPLRSVVLLPLFAFIYIHIFPLFFFFFYKCCRTRM